MIPVWRSFVNIVATRYMSSVHPDLGEDLRCVGFDPLEMSSTGQGVAVRSRPQGDYIIYKRWPGFTRATPAASRILLGDFVNAS